MSFAGLSNMKKGTMPTAQKTLSQELQERMEEFLEMDRFSLVVQPVVDFRTNTVSNGEVLSRLEHPERGVIFPDQFLPVIDALDLYPRFDRYVFQKSCVWLRRSLAEGEKFDCISCNFSRQTLSDPTIAQDLIKIADSNGLSHRMLAVEITEREQKSDEAQLIANLKVLKESGFRIILDDYGSGVTCEKDLLDFPLDIVKIDRSILLNAETEQGKAEFCALVTKFMDLGADVVCEGIETKEQNDFVRDCGCHYGQGFLYFKPIRQEQVFEMIRKSSLFEDTV